jgi:hypothetical protein
MNGSFATVDHSASPTGSFEAADNTPAVVNPFTVNKADAWVLTNPITSCLIYCIGAAIADTCNILAKVTL